MNHADQLSLPLGRKARDAGITKSSAANATWIERCLRCLKDYWLVRESACQEFPMEFFRTWWELHYSRSPLQPTNHHAWGALTTAAVQRGIIEWTGRYTQASSKKTHAHPVKVWRRGPSTEGAS